MTGILTEEMPLTLCVPEFLLPFPYAIEEEESRLQFFSPREFRL
jgi:hypothetical protein